MDTISIISCYNTDFRCTSNNQYLTWNIDRVGPFLKSIGGIPKSVRDRDIIFTGFIGNFTLTNSEMFSTIDMSLNQTDHGYPIYLFPSKTFSISILKSSLGDTFDENYKFPRLILVYNF
jgi:hypothetical protein